MNESIPERLVCKHYGGDIRIASLEFAKQAISYAEENS